MCYYKGRFKTFSKPWRGSQLVKSSWTLNASRRERERTARSDFKGCSPHLAVIETVSSVIELSVYTKLSGKMSQRKLRMYEKQ